MHIFTLYYLGRSDKKRKCLCVSGTDASLPYSFYLWLLDSMDEELEDSVGFPTLKCCYCCLAGCHCCLFEMDFFFFFFRERVSHVDYVGLNLRSRYIRLPCTVTPSLHISGRSSDSMNLEEPTGKGGLIHCRQPNQSPGKQGPSFLESLGSSSGN